MASIRMTRRLASFSGSIMCVSSMLRPRVLAIAEQALDPPAPSVLRERLYWVAAVCRHQQPFTIGQTFGGDKDRLACRAGLSGLSGRS